MSFNSKFRLLFVLTLVLCTFTLLRCNIQLLYNFKMHWIMVYLFSQEKECHTESILVCQAQFLLAKFNSVQNRIRKVADKCVAYQTIIFVLQSVYFSGFYLCWLKFSLIFCGINMCLQPCWIFSNYCRKLLTV